MLLFAVHLSDLLLPESWCLIGYLAAAALAAIGCWNLHERDVPRIALATAALFIASSIHVPVPMSSVHLVLNGMIGILLGHRAALALFVGLFLQAILMHHGGIYTLGVNVVVQALPAFAAGALFRLAASSSKRSPAMLAACGGALSFACVIVTVLLQSSLLRLAAIDDGNIAALLWIGLHVPIGVVEAIVVGFMVNYLAHVKPDMLGIRPLPNSTAELQNSEGETETVH